MQSEAESSPKNNYDDDYKMNTKSATKGNMPINGRSASSSAYYTQKPIKASKIIDLSFDDY